MSDKQKERELEVRRRIYSVDADEVLIGGWANIVVYGFILLFIGLMVWMGYAPNTKAQTIREEAIPSVQKEIDEAEKELKEQEAFLAEEMDKLTAEHTGVKPSVVQNDRKFLIGYFDEILGWKNGADYDAGREKLIDLLGPGAREVTEFMTENEKADDDFNYVDWKNIESELAKFSLYPLDYENGGERVTYYVLSVYHITDRNVSNSVPINNYALMKVTVEGPLDNREITDLSLGQGFEPEYVAGLGHEGDIEFEQDEAYEGLTSEQTLDRAFNNYIKDSVKRDQKRK